MAIREGRWDCSSCGSTAIYGRHVDCPGCGKPRPAGVRFYLAHGEPVVTDPERLREAAAGPDWVCARCGASNRATLHACAGCGAAHEVESVQPVAEYTLANTPRSAEDGGTPPANAPAPESATGSRPESPTGSASGSPAAASAPSVGGSAPPSGLLSAGSATPPPAVPPPPASGTPENGAPVPRYWVAVLFGSEEGWTWWRPRLRKGGAVVAGLVGLMMLIVLAGQMHSRRTRPPVPAVVQAVVWDRTIYIEEHGIFAGEGWTLPDSAMDVVRSQRVSAHRQELAGYETVTREVPRTRQVLTGYRDETRTVQEREQTGTRTYTCGSRDLGNGYFEDVECTEPEYETVSRTERVSVPEYEDETYYETVTEETPIYRQVPVMAPYYTYREPRWTPVDTLRLAGTWMTPPAWPAVDSLSPTRRERWRYANNQVVIRTDGRTLRVWVEEDQLSSLRPGQRVAYGPEGGRRGLSTILPTDSLPACRRWHSGRGKPPPSSFGCSPRAADSRRR